MTATLPSLRLPQRPDSEPAYDRRNDLNRREDDLDRRERALSESESRLRERERVANAERRLDLDVARRELDAEQIKLLVDEEFRNVTSLDRRSPQQIQALANRALEAGKLRRGELPNDPLPGHPLARAAILAGAKRRGEIDQRGELELAALIADGLRGGA
jgi:hypothetical protein